MMPGLDLKNLGDIVSKGLISEFAPTMTKGILVAVLKQEGVTVKRVSDAVQARVSLWGSLGEKYQMILMELRSKVASIEWLSAEWVVEALRDDLPAIASLFLGWKKAHNWLEREVKKVRDKLG